MHIILLGTDFWTKFSAISAGAAAIATVIYVCFTWNIFKATSDAAKETAKAATSNAIANELSAYLTLKADLTTDIFNTVVKYCRLNQIKITNMLPNNVESNLEDDIFYIKDSELVTKVLNNLEDLALFLEKDVLQIETIDSGYGYSILNIGNNSEIRRWLIEEKNNGSEAFSGFERLYELIHNRLESEIERGMYKPKLYDTND